MKAFVFPGQGSQFSGMGKDLWETNDEVKALFKEANEILGFDIQTIMFEGSAEDLKETKVTQPAIFIHSCAIALANSEQMKPDMVAGHSLGEFSALVANKTLAFKDALTLVSKRAMAMQKACEKEPSTMAAVLGIEDKVKFLGNSNEIDKILCFSDLFLLPSQTESFGLAALEAMASGVPVISSNTGGIPEVNKQGVSGYLSNVGDVEDMTKNALSILKDANVLNQFKENAKKESLQFDIHAIVPHYEDIYRLALTRCVSI